MFCNPLDPSDCKLIFVGGVLVISMLASVVVFPLHLTGALNNGIAFADWQNSIGAITEIRKVALDSVGIKEVKVSEFYFNTAPDAQNNLVEQLFIKLNCFNNVYHDINVTKLIDNPDLLNNATSILHKFGQGPVSFGELLENYESQFASVKGWGVMFGLAGLCTIIGIGVGIAYAKGKCA